MASSRLPLPVVAWVCVVLAAVATGQIAWAWACIGVGAVGLFLLLIDLIRGHGRGGSDAPVAAEETDARTDG